ncbi:hypothetical protein HLASA_0673 [Halanaeroarchaeum sulfurireducens]|uniref:Helix-hairpin-helix domain-containing protein n=1 Tax=Halanaeroarchaeum sulfurireducens TaxID=1604004 RepID=A0A0N9N489_9EURY|nr:hypothetical protein HLASA_0673 [Halanaeroarchaeum sulfurireducens]
MDTILSLLGLNSKGNRGTSADQITVEREPEAKAERAVKEPVGAESEEGDDDLAETEVTDSENNDVAEIIEDAVAAETDSEAVDTPHGDDDDTERVEDDTAEVDSDEDDTAEVDSDEDDTAEVDSDEDDTAEVDSDEDDTAEVDSDEDDTAEVDSDEDDTAEVDAGEPSGTDDAETDVTADPDTGVSDDETAITDDRELTTEDASAGSVEEGEPLTDIKGIGPAYADRLTDAGVDDVATLVSADPDALSEDIDVSPKRIQRWIDRAQ